MPDPMQEGETRSGEEEGFSRKGVTVAGETQESGVMRGEKDPGTQADQRIVGEVDFFRLVHSQDAGPGCLPHRLRHRSRIMMVHGYMDDCDFHC